MPETEEGLKVNPKVMAAAEPFANAPYPAGRRGDVAPPTRPDEPIFAMVADAQKSRASSTRDAYAPEDTPDIIRTTQMIDGAIQALERAAAELAAHLAPFLRDPDAPHVRGAEAAKKAAEGSSKLLPESAHGQQLWSLYSRLSAVESVLAVTDSNLAV